jgi:hypothetical protein
VKSGKLKASCNSRYSQEPLAYDLIHGIDEGNVVTLLKIGSRTFCAAFDDNGRSDGSDGKRFRGERNFPRPLSCASIMP